MGKIMRNGKKYSGASSSMAENIVYDNTESRLEANDVQGAVDELNTSINELNSNMVNKVQTGSSSGNNTITFDFSKDKFNDQYLLIINTGTSGDLVMITVYTSSLGVSVFNKYETDTFTSNGRVLTFSHNGNRHYSLIKLN